MSDQESSKGESRMNDGPGKDNRFSALLVDFDTDGLDHDSATIYGLWPDLTLAYVNLKWFEFARLNGGEPGVTEVWAPGRCVLDAIAASLRPFFTRGFQRSLDESKPWEHLYECSSADEFREFHMTTFPLGQAEGLLVVNSLRRATAHTRVPCAALEELYLNEDGIVTQCSHCRRVRRVQEKQVWDWVPQWVSAPLANLSHGLCEPCFGFHYSEQRENSGGFAESFRTYSTLNQQPAHRPS